MRWNGVKGTLVLTVLVATSAGCGAGRVERTSAGDVTVGPQPTLETVVGAWSSASRTAANQMIAKYGPPDEHTASMLVWHDRGPFRHTIVHRDGVDHAFPRAHVDIIEQVIAYRVPPEMTDELAAFNGSLTVDRTRGELSVRSEQEAMNILALNLADEIVGTRSTVTDARITYALQSEALAAGRSGPLTERLAFRTAGTDSRDPDTPLSPPRR